MVRSRAVRSLLRNLRGLATRSVSSVASQQPHSAVPESSDPTAARLGRARALIQQGHLGRATKSLFQLPLPVVDEKVLPSLQDLHPASSGTAAPLPGDAPLLQVVDLDALASIVRSSLANGAAPGGSGWTGDLLKALIGDQDCLHGLASLTRDIINGALTGRSRELLLSSVLIAARKSNGGLRPIAMGEAFYKLSCLYMLSVVRKDIPGALGPMQFALSPGGSESAVLVLQAAMDSNPDWVLISTDLSNAFNTRSRPQILDSLFVTQSLAPLWRLAHWSYGLDTSLLVMNHGRVFAELSSCEGVRQGDVLGSLLFSLSMRDPLVDCTQGLDCHVTAVMDDIYFYSPLLPPLRLSTLSLKRFLLLVRISRSTYPSQWFFYLPPLLLNSLASVESGVFPTPRSHYLLWVLLLVGIRILSLLGWSSKYLSYMSPSLRLSLTLVYPFSMPFYSFVNVCYLG